MAAQIGADGDETMKNLLLAAAATVLLAGGGAAWAQMPGQAAVPAPGSDAQQPAEHHGMEGGEHEMHGHGGGHWMRMMMQGTKSAHFHFRRGENAVDIRCAADEPTKACVEAATTLMDKLAAQPAR